MEFKDTEGLKEVREGRKNAKEGAEGYKGSAEKISGSISLREDSKCVQGMLPSL